MSEKDLFHCPYFVCFLKKVQTGEFIGSKDEKWQKWLPHLLLMAIVCYEDSTFRLLL